MSRCPFCDIVEPVLLRNRHALAINDQHPISPGHSLVVPTVHVESIFALPLESYLRCFELLRQLKDCLQETHSPAGFNVVVNSGKAAGQTVAHAHIHLVPRYPDDILDLGIRAQCDSRY